MAYPDRLSAGASDLNSNEELYAVCSGRCSMEEALQKFNILGKKKPQNTKKPQ